MYKNDENEAGTKNTQEMTTLRLLHYTQNVYVTINATDEYCTCRVHFWSLSTLALFQVYFICSSLHLINF